MDSVSENNKLRFMARHAMDPTPHLKWDDGNYNIHATLAALTNPNMTKDHFKAALREFMPNSQSMTKYVLDASHMRGWRSEIQLYHDDLIHEIKPWWNK